MIDPETNEDPAAAYQAFADLLQGNEGRVAFAAKARCILPKGATHEDAFRALIEGARANATGPDQLAVIDAFEQRLADE